MKSQFAIRLVVAALGCFCGGLTCNVRPVSSASASPPETQTRAAFARLPLRFEANQGQAPARVKFLARGPQAQLWLNERQVSLQMDRQQLALTWRHAARAPQLAGLDAVPERSHYLRGNDPRRWQTNVPRFARVRYQALYPGVDLIFYDRAQTLEYDFVLAPGADARRIQWQFHGQRALRRDAAGGLVLQLGGGAQVTQRAPVAYQETARGRVKVDARYRLFGQGRAGFALGRYDKRLPLVIDPVLEYSTLLGGSGGDEAFALRVDGAGNSYLAGQTTSTDLPGAGPLQAVPGGAGDAFVAKVNAAGTALLYATYLGGSALDYATALALDAQGNAYVTGATYSNDFPQTGGNAAQANKGYADVFVARLDATGSQLGYSTLLGGNAIDVAYAIAVNGNGAASIAGRADSADLPNAPRLGQPLYRSADQGANWSASANGLTAFQTNASAVARGNPNIVYAATSQGVFKSTDGGAAWQAVAGTRDVYCYTIAVDPRDPQVSYLGTTNGLFKSSDGGARYESLTGYNALNGFRAVYHVALDPNQPATLYVGGQASFAKSSDGGAAFTPLQLSFSQQVVLRVNRIGIDPTNSQVVYAASPLGLSKSVNGGATWEVLRLTPQSGPNFFGAEGSAVIVDPKTPNTLYVSLSNANGSVLKSSDGGATWAPANRGLYAVAGDAATLITTQSLALDPQTPATLYAASFAGGLFRSTDGGANWSPAVRGLNNLQVTGLTVDDAGRLWAGTIAGSDVLFAQLNSSGALTALRLLGGSESDEARALTLDNAGNIYLTGRTLAANFPTRNPLQAANRGFSNLQPTADAFVTKLNPAGTETLYSTYLGGNGNDTGTALAINAQGQLVSAGNTASTDFPTTAGAHKAVKADFNQDVFVATLNAAGTALTAATYLGGVGEDNANAVAVDASGNLFVTGSTRSADFPTLNGLPLTPSQFSSLYGFVTKLDPAAAALRFSTLLAGRFQASANGLGLDDKRNLYVSGATSSADFPLLNPLPNSPNPNSVNAFLLRLTPQADLAVSSAAQHNPVQAGQSYRYTVTVTNLGPDEATGIVLSDVIPNGLTNAAASASTGANACTVAATLQCHLGELAAGASATVTLTGTAPATGTLNQTARVASDTLDAADDNNRATLATVVTAAPSLAGLVTTANGARLSGVTLTLGSDGVNNTKVSDANGAYQFAELTRGRNYTVSAARGGFVMRPASLSFANLQTDQSANFTATACAFTLTANQRVFAAGGGGGTLSIAANDAACAWQIRGNAPWLTLTGNGAGSGNGTLAFTVAATTATRAATLSLGAQLVTITQEFDACATPALRVAAGFGVPAAGSDFTEGDFNGDGQTDLVWSNTPVNAASVWLGDGRGGFSATPRVVGFGIAANRFVSAFATGDLNGDGRSDLAAVAAGPSQLIAVLANADGSFGAPRLSAAPENTNVFRLARMNGDNRADAVLTGFNNGGFINVALSNGDGTFAAVGAATALGQTGDILTGDLNNDGKTDVVVAASTTLYFFTGDGTGKLTAGAARNLGGFYQLGTGVLADFDRDGNLDLATINRFDSFVNALQIHRGNGRGELATPSFLPGVLAARQMVARDFDHDGWPDLAATAENGTTVSLFANDGAGAFAPAAQANYHAGTLLSGIAAGDFNRDGQLDFAVPVAQTPANGNTARIVILTRSGIDWVAARASLLPLDNHLVVAGDFNNDGLTDLVLRNGNSNLLSMRLGNGGGAFSAVSGPAFSLAGFSNTVVARDFNRDGNLDLIAENGFTVSLYVGDGTGRLANPRQLQISPAPNDQFSSAVSAPLAWGDFNRDGREDLATVTQTRQPVLFFATAEGGFSAPQPFGGGLNITRLVAGDFNGDGRADLLGYTQSPSQCGNDGTVVTFFPGAEGAPFGPPVRSVFPLLPNQVLAEDFNGDGRTELLVFGGCFTQVPAGVATLNAQGGFTLGNRFVSAAQPSHLAWRDFNNDGRNDVLLALPNATSGGANVMALALLAARADGGFDAPVTLAETIGSTVATGDFNGDGRADVLTSTSSFSSLTVLTVFTNRCVATRALALTSAASYGTAQFAPASIAAAFGTELATATEAARATPLPETLAGTRVNVLDAAGQTRAAGLYFVSPTQVNLLLPAGLANGPAQITLTNGAGVVSSTAVRIAATAPGLFAANGDGQGVPAAYVLRVRGGGQQSAEPVARFDAATQRFVPQPLEFGPAGDQLFLVLFGTGIRGHSGLASVSLKLGGLEAPVEYAGAQGSLLGLDQLNVSLPRALQGRGDVDVALTVELRAANVLRLAFR